MKILVLAAGGTAKNKELGLGHIFRTLNLVENLSSEKIFFLIEDHGGVRKILKDRNYKNTFFLKKNETDKYKKLKIIEYVKKLEIDVIVIDWSKLNNSIVNSLKKYAKTVIITDLKNKDFNVDLVINGFIGFRNSVTKNKFGVKCLLGPKYQILNNKFRKFKRSSNQVTVLTTFGGFDEKNISLKFLKILFKSGKIIKTRVILGQSTPNNKKLNNIAKKMTNFVEIKKSTNDMYEEITSTKFGICSGGLTTYEFAAMKIPFIILCQHKHQLLTANEWEKHGIGKNLGIHNNISEKKILEIIGKIENDSIILKNKLTVDGKGALRVANEIRKLDCKSHL